MQSSPAHIFGNELITNNGLMSVQGVRGHTTRSMYASAHCQCKIHEPLVIA